MQVLNTEMTKQALPFDRLITALEHGFQQEVTAPLRHHHLMQNAQEADSVLLLMPAWHQQGFGGVKMVNVVPGNAMRGLTSISSSYVLFDRETGQHLLLVDGGELTARRTAAASALAAKKIARADSETLLVVGAGRVAQNIPYAYRSVFSLKTVLVHNRSSASAIALMEHLRKDGFDAQLAPDLEEAVHSADIISCATLSKQPLIQGRWLSAGQHVDLIGGFTPDMREADDETIRLTDVFVDTDHALVECGDMVIPLSQGVLSKDDICGNLIQLCKEDRAGRTHRDQITLFKSVGSAIEDLAAATLAFELQNNN